MKSALLLSGGMDSLALAWWKHPDIAITVDYGQLAAQAEIAASRAICHKLGITNYVLSVNCRCLGSGDMAGTATIDEAPASDWWPYRNQLLITLAAMKAISLKATCLWIGTVSNDCQHKDGTQDFVETISLLISRQEGELQVEAPAITLSTTELIRKSNIPLNCLAWAHSCHKSNVACKNCRGCNKYFKTFAELGYDWD